MKNRRPVQQPLPPEGYVWFRNFIPLRGGHYNCAWRIAKVQDGRVMIFGQATWLDPGCDFLRNVLWGPEILPPPTGETEASVLATPGPRRRGRRRQEAVPVAPARPLDPATVKDVAEGIVQAFVDVSGDLRNEYCRRPERLAELVEVVVAVMERVFGGEGA